MADETPTWGEERLLAELLLELGIRISPRTVRRYMPPDKGPQRGPSSQRWMTLVRNNAQGILAYDILLTVTANFPALYVFAITEAGTRRIAHFDVTDHPSADWTLQQFREDITGEKTHRFLIHDRDSFCSSELNSTVKSVGLSILKTPFRAPRANGICELLAGTIRRECWDFLIPLKARHLRRILEEWVAHDNKARPHFSLGPGIPELTAGASVKRISGYWIPSDHQVLAEPIL